MIVEDHFRNRVSPYWVRFALGNGQIELTPHTVRFSLEGATADQVSDAEIDDHRHHDRDHLPWLPPLKMVVRARTSHPSGELLGTAGFGFWNEPSGWEKGLVAPPNSVWFFYASPPSDMVFVPDVPGHGWKAAMVNGGRANALTMALGRWLMELPVARRLVYHLGQSRLNAAEKVLADVDMTAWHTYTLHWLPERAIFAVDGREVFRADNPPRVRLGFVAWLDNQYAVVKPDGEISFGLLDVPQRQWLELDYVRIEREALRRKT
ncbi:MAG: hypothetical protein ACE5NP_07005 [Anaerolineae bacterium]